MGLRDVLDLYDSSLDKLRIIVGDIAELADDNRDLLGEDWVSVLYKDGMVLEDLSKIISERQKRMDELHNELVGLHALLSEEESRITKLEERVSELEAMLEEDKRYPHILWEAVFRDGGMDGFYPATTEESPGLDCPDNPHRQRDVSAHVVDDVSALSGVFAIAGVHGGGSPVMEEIAILRSYDFDERVKLAKYLAGIEEKYVPKELIKDKV